MLFSDVESTDKLGKTGQTVVYVFPRGVAYKARNKKDVFNQIDTLVAEQPTLLEADPIEPEAVVRRLIQQGKLTDSQLQVARYDQQTTGLGLLDALMARGWLNADLNDEYWDQLP